MKKGYKKVRNMYAIRLKGGLAGLCNARDSIVELGTSSPFLKGNEVNSLLTFVEKMGNENCITCIEVTGNKIKETDLTDSFIFQGDDIYMKQF